MRAPHTAPCYGCPDRAVGCRSGCQPWKDYEAERDANYHERAIQRVNYAASPAKIRNMNNKARQKRRGRT